MSTVLGLHELGRDDIARAGGKGANLGELIKAGFDVPDGFVLTTEAYAAALEAAQLSLPPQDQDDPAAFREQVCRVPILETTRREIASAYANLGAGPVAVRSSATAEDLPGATFAGQQDSFLNVLGEQQLIDAIRQCWASLWTERAVAYRRRRRIEPSEVRIAVVVQTMVPAEAAGVMFTANPITGARDQTVVDASSGLGEAVVSGAVTPDHYVLDSDGRLVEFSLGRRELAVVGKAGGGVEHRPGGATVRLLPDDTLQTLTALGSGVSRHFGQPQDIEWALSDGRLSVVQTRPITALPPAPLDLSRFQRLQGSILLEMLTLRPYPIDMTTWIPYGPAGIMADMTAFFGVRGLFSNFLLEDSEGVVVSYRPPSPHFTLGVLRAPYRLVARMLRYDPARWQQDPRATGFRASIRDASERRPAEMSWPQLVRHVRESLELMRPITELRIDYLPSAAVALARLQMVLRLLGRRSLFAELIVGAPTLTAAANRGLESLADRVRGDDQIRAALETGGLERLDDYPEFAAAFREYLDNFGARETTGLVVATAPTWGESPEMVVDLIAGLAAGQPARSDGGDEAMAGLSTHWVMRYRGPAKRVQRWVATARIGVAFREDTHAEAGWALPIFRRALLEAGRRLGTAGVLDTPEDVYHLRLEELEAIADASRLDPGERERLRDVMRRRSARREELTGVPLIDPNLVFPPLADDNALVTGTPAGGGRVSGAVRVVREPSEFGTLRQGEILVCPATNPSWTPLFQRAAAVVVDSGGLGSHAAIVAREYGIPAIMGTGRGTSVLSNGQQVIVDGGSGRVMAHDPEGSK
ncbi:MAG TPA: PEP/pyruvate-binding domain-containing protein [Propionibacteriaceae bacterium]